MVTVILVFSGLLGAAVGSFLNVCIYRMPREGLSVSRPRRSFCPGCGAGIAWHDNIPVVSWLVLGGRCRACRAPISSRYVLVEMLAALLFVLVARQFLLPELSVEGFAVIAVLVSALIVASFIDLELRSIPDEITIRGMMAAPLAATLVPGLHARPGGTVVSRWLEWMGAALVGEAGASPFPAVLQDGPALWAIVVGAGALFFAAGLHGYGLYWRIAHRDSPRPLRDGLLSGVLSAQLGAVAALCVLRPDFLLLPRIVSFWSALLGMAVGATLVFAVGVAGTKVFRKPAMGFGDVKLMGLLGAFTGWAGVVELFFVACLLGAFVGVFVLLRYKSRYIPFGPFLAMGGLVLILWPDGVERLMAWYMRLFGG